MYNNNLLITQGADPKNEHIRFFSFFSEEDVSQSNIIAEITYINHTQNTIKIVRMHTANLVKNTLVDPKKFGDNMGKKYPGLGIACLNRFIREMRSKENTKKIILLSVPNAIGFYRKAANNLLENGEIIDWRQGAGYLRLNKIPVFFIEHFGEISDHVFEFQVK